MRAASLSKFETWKATDLFLREFGGSYPYWQYPVLVFKQPLRVRPQDRDEMWYVVRPVWTTRGWTVVHMQYSEAYLKKFDYYHLTGILDGSDYLTGDEDKLEQVDEYILGASPGDAMKHSGYPVAFHGGWYERPALRKMETFDDRLDVVRDRLLRHIVDADWEHMLGIYIAEE